MKDISVIIPLHNEFETLESLTESLMVVLDKITCEYELIFINDGSSDSSSDILVSLANKNPKINIITFSKQRGKTECLSAGFKAAEGNIVITIDADLQNDPQDIPSLLSKLEEGYDAVGGWRQNRKGHFFLTQLPSKIANILISRCIKFEIHDNGCGLKVYKSEVVKGFELKKGQHRFLLLLAFLNGFRIAEIPVKDNPRQFGKSKYNILKAFDVIFDLIYILSSRKKTKGKSSGF